MQHHTIDHPLTFIQWLHTHLMLLTLTTMTQPRVQNSEAVAGGVLKNFPIMSEPLFYKVAGLEACSCTIKKRLLHRWFPVKFEKFLRTLISKNIRRMLMWLLHHILIYYIFTIHYSTRASFLQITSSLLHN